MFLRSLRTLVIQLQMSNGIKLNRVVPCRFSRGTRDERHDDWNWLSYQRGCLKKTEIRTQNDTSEIGTKPGKITASYSMHESKCTVIVEYPQFQQNFYFCAGFGWCKTRWLSNWRGRRLGFISVFTMISQNISRNYRNACKCRIIPVPYQQQTLAMSPGVPSPGKNTVPIHGTCRIVFPNDASASCHPSISPVVLRNTIHWTHRTRKIRSWPLRWTKQCSSDFLAVSGGSGQPSYYTKVVGTWN